MFAIEVNLLMGRYFASKFNDPNKGEWPPHPARLFSALVATWADAEAPASDERAALEWLQALPPPDIKASEASFRKVLGNFVPVNDVSLYGKSGFSKAADAVDEALKIEDVSDREKALSKARDVASLIAPKTPNASALKEASAMLPEGRAKQERTFPSATPQDPCISYVWDEEIEEGLFTSLDALASRVTRLGHSASLVSCAVREKCPEPNWVSGEFDLDDQKMRWVYPDQLAQLESDFDHHRAEKTRFLPFQDFSYKKIKAVATDERVEPYVPSTYGDCYFFEFLAPWRRMSISQAVRMTDTFRGAVMSYSDDPQPEGLSGHQVNGRPSQSPHVVFAAMPHVGYRGDGRVMGLLMIVPPESVMGAEARTATFKAIANWENEVNKKDIDSPLGLELGKAGVFQMHRVRGESTSTTLQESTWAKPRRLWRSVTPIALPKHPGNLFKGSANARSRAWDNAEESIRRSCEHIGLPSPEQINLSRDPFWEGSPPAGKFPVFKQGSNPAASFNRALVHAEVLFDRPVKGPLLLGAGRYRGLGLMRPVSVKPQAKAQVKQHA